MQDIIIGIDLGTTNSEVAVPHEGKIVIVEENGNPILPSCVGLDDQGNLITGEAARNQAALYPEKTILSIKRKMGTDEVIALGDGQYSPQDISAVILRQLKKRAEKFLGRPVSKAVITVPAQFSDAQRQATRDAGQIAGLEVVRILNEPTAACLAYQSEPEENGKNILAFDFGGGTLDVSIVHMEKDIIEVVASHGDNHLGGDDIDEEFAESLKKQLETRLGHAVTFSFAGQRRLHQAAEIAKKRLSEKTHAKIIEEDLKTTDAQSIHLDEEISRYEFNELIDPIIQKALHSVYQALELAGLQPEQIQEVILVGGSTRIPVIHEILEAQLGRRPLARIHPDLAVAYGAGIMASRLMGQTDNRVLVDITPYTFGTSAIGMVNGIQTEYCFVPIIKSGTPLPTTQSQLFSTYFDYQTKVDIRIFQGENQDARQNIFIGNFMVEGLAEVPAPNEIIVSMDLDLNGILRVRAIEKKTQLSKQITLQDAMARMEAGDIERSRQKILELFGETADPDEWDESEGTWESHGAHGAQSLPPEADPGASGLQSRYEELEQRVEELLPQMDDVDKNEAAQFLDQLKNACKDGDEEAFEAMVERIEDLLFYLEV